MTDLLDVDIVELLLLPLSVGGILGPLVAQLLEMNLA